MKGGELSEIQPTSLFNSFWELLESGLDPLIFIPSEAENTQKKGNNQRNTEAFSVLEKKFQHQRFVIIFHFYNKIITKLKE